MAEKRHIITHKDGRSYSVTRDAFHRHYEPQGFEITGEESAADFIVTGIPKPKAQRAAPRSKAAPKPKPAAPLAAVPEP